MYFQTFVKWPAREYVIDTGQKSLEQTADMRQVKNDVQHVRFSSTGKAITVHVVDLHLEQDPRAQTQDKD